MARVRLRAVAAGDQPRLPARPRRPARVGGGDRRGRRSRALCPVPPPTRPGVAPRRPLRPAPQRMVLGYLDDDDADAVGVADPHLVEAPRLALGWVGDVDTGRGKFAVR